MLCHQMALAHEASMRLMDRALAYEARNEGMNACSRWRRAGWRTRRRG